MKLDVNSYLDKDIILALSKHIERFDLHKIENEIIFFWQPKKNTIQDFEYSGASFENYLEDLFDCYKIDFGHCYLDPCLDFKEGIDCHYHLSPEEIQRVNNMETGEGMFLFQSDTYVCRYDVFDVMLSDKKENGIMEQNSKFEFDNVRDLKLNLYKIISCIGTKTESDRLGLVDEIITTFSYVNENCQRELDVNGYVDISILI